MQGAQGKRQLLVGIIITAAVFLGMVIALSSGLGQVNTRNDHEQAAILEDAVRRSTMLCYAVEGRYPTSASELRERYGLVYDEERFIVVLDGFATNLLPDIRVLAVGGNAYE